MKRSEIPTVFALVSTYKCDELLASCIYSARYCDRVFVFDGTTQAKENSYHIGGTYAQKVHEITRGKVWPNMIPLTCGDGEWVSDAAKRTQILKVAKSVNPHAWGLWLDDDEILLHGEYLHDLCWRSEQETATGGTTIRLVEYDGSVYECFGKLIRLANVEKYVMSSYEVELVSGMTVALPNVPICTAGGIPLTSGEHIVSADDERLGKLRPPLQGEPHLLHRHGLRNPKRKAARMHDKEAEDFASMVSSERKDNA